MYLMEENTICGIGTDCPEANGIQTIKIDLGTDTHVCEDECTENYECGGFSVHGGHCYLYKDVNCGRDIQSGKSCYEKNLLHPLHRN